MRGAVRAAAVRRRARLGVGLALAWAAGLSQAASLAFCDAPPKATAAQQDKLLRFGAIVKAELERAGPSVALVARSGTNLRWIGQRYSHGGLSLRDSDNAPWSVRQLYYACDEGRPRVFDQGIAGFLSGTDDPSLGYVSLLLLPGEPGEAVARAALDKARALQLLGGQYSANAYAYSTRYQNCNQWVAELLASAWGPGGPQPRVAAQQWLRSRGYQPEPVETGALFGLSAFIPWTHSDDHPPEQLARTVFEVSMPTALERFARQQVPGATRLELCHTERQVVLRRDGPPLAEGCVAAPGDTVIALD